MTSLSDTLTVGLVLVLLFGSVALYLYTRIQQAEQKISLLESILLDLKMSSEIKSYTELPASSGLQKGGSSTEKELNHYTPYDDTDDMEAVENMEELAETEIKSKATTPTPSVSSRENDENDVEQYKSVVAEAFKSEDSGNQQGELPFASKISVNYESMTLKELQTLGKTRGISGASSMKKGAIIDALKNSDNTHTNTIEPGSSGAGLFLETASPFLGSESK
jgi:hypothetical protein